MSAPLDITVTGESQNFQVHVTFARDEVASVAISRTLLDPQKQPELERSVKEAVNAAIGQYTSRLEQALARIPGRPPEPEEITRLQATLEELLGRTVR